MQTQQTLTPLGTAVNEEFLTERRRHPRSAIPARAIVQGTNDRGEEFAAEAELKDLSASGLYARLAERVEPGTELTATLLIFAGASCGITEAGQVLRVEALIDGRYGVAVALVAHGPR